MQEMIQELVDVDLSCSKRVEEAKQKKFNIQKNLNKQREIIHQSFLEEQRQKVEEYRREIEAKGAREEEIQKEVFAKKRQELDTIYQQNKDKWVNSIVERCLQ